MKLIIWLIFLASLCSILLGYFTEYIHSQKLIGFGIVGLFFVVFPLFSYYRWKDKDLKDYMINKENLDKMRNHKKKY
jgi:MFS-type transporter involved in bile tolerance (Atg22 family)